MPRFRLIVLAAACVCATLSARSAPVKSPPFPHEQSDIAPDPNVVWGRLENGLRYAILPRAKPENRVSLVLVVQAGSYHENAEESGYAHFVEHMVFNGTTHFPDNSAVRALEDLGLSFGAHTNAETGQFETEYKIFDLPANRPQALNTGLRILRDFADGALFERRQVKSEAKVVLNELLHSSSAIARYGEDPSDLFSDSEKSNSLLVNERDGLFDETDVESHKPAGKIRSVRRATPARLRAFYRAWYRPERMILAVVGDIEPTEAEAEIQRSFASLTADEEPPPEPPPPVPYELEFTPPRLFVRSIFDPAKNYVAIANTTSSETPDSLAARREALALQVALDYIEKDVNWALPNAVSTESGIDHTVPGWALPFVRVTCSSNDISPTALRLVRSLSHTLSDGFGPKRFAQALERAATRSDFRSLRTQSASSAVFAESLALSVARGNVFAAEEETTARERAWLSEITAEECSKALRRIWNSDTATVLVNSSQSPRVIYSSSLAVDLTRALEPKSSDKESDTEAVVSDEETQFTPPSFDLEENATVVDKRYIAELDATIIDFANGVRLNVKQLPEPKDSVALRVQFGYGELATKDTDAGMGNSLAFLFGSDTHDLGAPEGRTFDLSLNVMPLYDRFELRLDATKESLPTILDFLSKLISEPNYGNEPKGRTLVGSGLNRLRRDLNKNVFREFLFQATSQHFLFRPAATDRVNAQTTEDYANWLAPMLRNAPMEITLVGDITPESATELVADTFGKFPNRSTEDELVNLRRFDTPTLPIVDIIERKGRSNTEATLLGWLTPETPGWTDDACRELLVRILRIRVTKKIREEKGQSYAPTVYQLNADALSSTGFVFFVKSSPRKQRKVSKALRSIMSSLLADGITEVELYRAKEQLKLDLRSHFDDPWFWMGLLSDTRRSLPEALDRIGAETVVNTVSASDLLAYAAEHLPLDKSIEVRTRHR